MPEESCLCANNTPRRTEVQLHTILASNPVEVYNHLLALSAVGKRQESGWASDLVWASCIREKYLSFAGNRTPTPRLHPVVHSPACFSQLQHIDMTFYRTSGKPECSSRFLSEHVRCSTDTIVCRPRLSLCGPEICDSTD